MKKHRYVLSVAILFLTSTIGFAQQKKSSTPSILGTWSFDRFAWEGDLAGFQPGETKKSNTINKGLTITYDSLGNFTSVQKGGIPQNNVHTKYKLVMNGKAILMSHDTLYIKKLDAHQLKLFHSEEQPFIYFKR